MSLTNGSPEQAGHAAKKSSRVLATLSEDARNDALDAVHDALANAREEILVANNEDLKLAKGLVDSGKLKPSIVKRLDLSRKGKFDDMLQGVRDVLNLPDPGWCSESLVVHNISNECSVQYYEPPILELGDIDLKPCFRTVC